MSTRVAAIMTVFNRREATLSCLRSLAGQAGPEVDLAVIVVDDASTDGTARSITESHPDVQVLHGSGQEYWNGGMRIGFGAAVAQGHDHHWWLNDDVQLDDGALQVLLDTAHQLRRARGVPAIVVGAMRHPDGGRTTYGGVVRRNALRPLDFSLVEPAAVPVQVETMNGNCVLIPDAIARAVGPIDPAFRQKMGDFDYGLRAGLAGFEVWLAPGTLGTCATHVPRVTTDQPLLQEVRRLWSTKELPPRAWAVFTRRWGGRLWPLYWASPYVRRTASLVGERLVPRAGAASASRSRGGLRRTAMTKAGLLRR